MGKTQSWSYRCLLKLGHGSAEASYRNQDFPEAAPTLVRQVRYHDSLNTVVAKPEVSGTYIVYDLPQSVMLPPTAYGPAPSHASKLFPGETDSSDHLPTTADIEADRMPASRQSNIPVEADLQQYNTRVECW
ncbi:hypothetical protein PoB_000105200 [Plakobranchus ocellatus]|uniref:Uncharacterized protein n=1 Tax=Plakobranchus ocellatus TaxID=259542 RepID=A0AAV3XWM5_9GAST|nr:hypothetical protein PoB_000105200 [Plakobranchus ocellatus]